MKLLHIGISAEVSLFDFPWVEQLLLIAFVYRLHIEQQVGILYRGEDETEETDGDASALRMGVVVDIGGGIEEVAMSFQLVVFLVGLQYLWDDNGCVGFCKRVAEVMHCITLSFTSLIISFLVGADIKTSNRTIRMTPLMKTMRPLLLLSSLWMKFFSPSP